MSLLFSYGNISNTLRYFAKLVTDKCADADRMFVIAFYLGDDTISVFEPIERNSGKRLILLSIFSEHSAAFFFRN